MMNEFDLVKLLIENKLYITTAESCTGGLVSAQIVNVPDASKTLKQAYVTYWADAKVSILGVKPETIEEYNVVSKEVAAEMALGACRAADANCAISVTGMAGPSSDGIIDVGTVCFGIAINGKVFTEEVKFGNLGRNNVRDAARDYAIDYAYRVISYEV